MADDLNIEKIGEYLLGFVSVELRPLVEELEKYLEDKDWLKAGAAFSALDSFFTNDGGANLLINSCTLLAAQENQVPLDVLEEMSHEAYNEIRVSLATRTLDQQLEELTKENDG